MKNRGKFVCRHCQHLYSTIVYSTKIIYAPQYNLGKISNTCRLPRRRNEGIKERNKHREDVMRCGVIPMQFHFLTYGMELYTNDSIPINTNIEQCMCMRASELRNFLAFLHS